MGSNRNFDGLRFLVGSSLVGAKGFLKSQGAYFESAFGTSTSTYFPAMPVTKKLISFDGDCW